MDSPLVSDSRPDTGAFNAVLNACSNLGDVVTGSAIFDKMPDWGCQPDILMFNIVIKICARGGRKDLLVFVLERILRCGLVSCTTTMHSLVAAYVGFGDLGSAERLVQCLREGRIDLCTVLRSLNQVGEALGDGDGLLEQPPPLLQHSN